ncbi:glycoside hydrolase family 3 N-terminal domain-containing protein [Protaetiibacter larvae]|uniref:beta-N-acetylhexosaminidase n=1 Tax=Protaetiibacter larvae TaxID=2592654 RepID=A0A5C1YA72_9MICO|nr:glycoside hydrolase family 3 N-terminal domain-containing protein [Protaetiibacter larvae]QEO09782.1 glycoside hydrolase family 3 protein [Protaetiibacter larvae]
MRTRAAGIGLIVAALALCACAGPAAAPVSTAPPRAWEQPAEPEPVDPDAAYVTARLAELSVVEQAAGVIMIRVPGTDAGGIKARLAETGVGGLILMGDNTAGSIEATAALTSGLAIDPGLPVLIAVDQEGGTVARLPDAGPSARALAGQAPEAARAAFAARAGIVAAAGIDVNFGIVADVTGDRRSFLAPRVFGADAASVSARVGEAVAGERGIALSTLKHFPGHGGAPGDSHAVIPQTAMSLEEWRASQAPPFAAGIAAGAELVMTGHLRYTAVDPAPASLSPAWYRILREELGFTGVAVTDDLSMLQASGEPGLADPYANGIAALAAGADLLLYVGPVDPAELSRRIAAAVADGTLPAARLAEAAERVLTLRRAVAPSDAPYVRCGELCEIAAR